MSEHIALPGKANLSVTDVSRISSNAVSDADYIIYYDQDGNAKKGAKANDNTLPDVLSRIAAIEFTDGDILLAGPSGTFTAADATTARAAMMAVGYTTATDNTIPKWDGTAGVLQTTSITADDSNNISGLGTINGVDLSSVNTELTALTTAIDVTPQRIALQPTMLKYSGECYVAYVDHSTQSNLIVDFAIEKPSAVVMFNVTIQGTSYHADEHFTVLVECMGDVDATDRTLDVQLGRGWRNYVSVDYIATNATSGTLRVQLRARGTVSGHRGGWHITILTNRADCLVGDPAVQTTAAAALDTMQATGFVNEFGGNVIPITDNIYSAGSAAARFSEVFSVNGVINTSDQTHKIEKTDGNGDPVCLTSHMDVEEFVDRIRMRVFKWVERKWLEVVDGHIEEKSGPGIRYHLNPFAQDIKTEMDRQGLSSVDFAGWILDADSNGDPIQGIRNDELTSVLWEYSKLQKQKIIAVQTDNATQAAAITALETADAELAADITALQSITATNTTNITNNATAIASNTTDITALQAAVAALQTAVSDLGGIL